MRKDHESAADYLRRIVDNLNCEDESLLDDIHSPAGLIAYFEVWDAYDTEYMSGMLECIECDGDDPAPLRGFVDRHVSQGVRHEWKRPIREAREKWRRGCVE